jgi:alkylation response protein AidB-like acyl-CoA dehydrogenase
MSTIVQGVVRALAARAEGASPIDDALLEGASAATIAAAFAAGYGAALRALVPSLPRDARACLCATEAGGAHPRAISTTLAPAPDGDGYLVDGEKRFVTGGPLADLLLVVATTGLDEAGRPKLRLVRVPARAEGVTLTEMPPLSFVPEIPHAEVRFAGVRVGADALLPGDGYARYVKPFRTIEDLHVHGALLAWLTAVGERSRFAPPLLERLAALLAATRALALADATAPATHVALAGLLQTARALLADLEPAWAQVDAPTRAQWERDRALLTVAERARTARTEAAWRTLADSVLDK